MKKAILMTATLFIFNNEVVSVIALTVISGLGLVAFLNAVAREKGSFR